MLPHVIRSIHRPNSEMVRRFFDFSPANIHEAQGQFGAMHSSIRPIYEGARLVGPALTVLGRPSDDLIHQVAIHVAQPGDVIVAQVGGDTEAGIWGELMALCAQRRGVAGLVIDGAVRDVAGIQAMQFPVFAKAICMKGTGKEKLGWINHPIVCGGVYVRPGDLVAADDDGVVVLPQERLQEILELCNTRQERERRTIEKIEAGMSTFEIQGLEELTKAKGLVWEVPE